LAGFKTAPLPGDLSPASRLQVGWGRKSAIFNAGSVPGSRPGAGTTVTAVEAIQMAEK